MRHFTHEEATEALEVVRSLVEELVHSQRSLRGHTAQLAAIQRRVRGNGHPLEAGHVEGLEQANEEASARLGGCFAELERLGVLVKDPERGLVDFPARHPGTGETVLLCWHLGEDSIAYWHGWDEGFGGRKPLPF